MTAGPLCVRPAHTCTIHHIITVASHYASTATPEQNTRDGPVPVTCAALPTNAPPHSARHRCCAALALHAVPIQRTRHGIAGQHVRPQLARINTATPPVGTTAIASLKTHCTGPRPSPVQACQHIHRQLQHIITTSLPLATTATTTLKKTSMGQHPYTVWPPPHMVPQLQCVITATVLHLLVPLPQREPSTAQ